LFTGISPFYFKYPPVKPFIGNKKLPSTGSSFMLARVCPFALKGGQQPEKVICPLSSASI
ncbi:MAG TPA: hypothetical protein PKX46_04590, partial [Clostridia bacterium]|nr:hypothetical protein [Clostridia bacterium]